MPLQQARLDHALQVNRERFRRKTEPWAVTSLLVSCVSSFLRVLPRDSNEITEWKSPTSSPSPSTSPSSSSYPVFTPSTPALAAASTYSPSSSSSSSSVSPTVIITPVLRTAIGLSSPLVSQLHTILDFAGLTPIAAPGQPLPFVERKKVDDAWRVARSKRADAALAIAESEALKEKYRADVTVGPTASQAAEDKAKRLMAEADEAEALAKKVAAECHQQMKMAIKDGHRDIQRGNDRMETDMFGPDVAAYKANRELYEGENAKYSDGEDDTEKVGMNMYSTTEMKEERRLKEVNDQDKLMNEVPKLNISNTKGHVSSSHAIQGMSDETSYRSDDLQSNRWSHGHRGHDVSDHDQGIHEPSYLSSLSLSHLESLTKSAYELWGSSLCASLASRSSPPWMCPIKKPQQHKHTRSPQSIGSHQPSSSSSTSSPSSSEILPPLVVDDYSECFGIEVADDDVDNDDHHEDERDHDDGSDDRDEGERGKDDPYKGQDGADTKGGRGNITTLEKQSHATSTADRTTKTKLGKSANSNSSSSNNGDRSGAGTRAVSSHGGDHSSPLDVLMSESRQRLRLVGMGKLDNEIKKSVQMRLKGLLSGNNEGSSQGGAGDSDADVSEEDRRTTHEPSWRKKTLESMGYSTKPEHKYKQIRPLMESIESSDTGNQKHENWGSEKDRVDIKESESSGTNDKTKGPNDLSSSSPLNTSTTDNLSEAEARRRSWANYGKDIDGRVNNSSSGNRNSGSDSVTSNSKPIRARPLALDVRVVDDLNDEVEYTSGMLSERAQISMLQPDLSRPIKDTATVKGEGHGVHLPPGTEARYARLDWLNEQTKSDLGQGVTVTNDHQGLSRQGISNSKERGRQNTDTSNNNRKYGGDSGSNNDDEYLDNFTFGGPFSTSTSINNNGNNSGTTNGGGTFTSMGPDRLSSQPNSASPSPSTSSSNIDSSSVSPAVSAQGRPRASQRITAASTAQDSASQTAHHTAQHPTQPGQVQSQFTAKTEPYSRLPAAAGRRHIPSSSSLSTSSTPQHSQGRVRGGTDNTSYPRSFPASTSTSSQVHRRPPNLPHSHMSGAKGNIANNMSGLGGQQAQVRLAAIGISAGADKLIQQQQHLPQQQQHHQRQWHSNHQQPIRRNIPSHASVGIRPPSGNNNNPRLPSSSASDLLLQSLAPVSLHIGRPPSSSSSSGTTSSTAPTYPLRNISNPSHHANNKDPFDLSLSVPQSTKHMAGPHQVSSGSIPSSSMPSNTDRVIRRDGSADGGGGGRDDDSPLALPDTVSSFLESKRYKGRSC